MFCHFASNRILAGFAAAAAASRWAAAWMFAALLGLAVLPQSAVSGESGPTLVSNPPPLPQHLIDTGLYVAGSHTTVGADNHPFTPQYPLWSDGAGKRRWIHLPPGTHIDASDPDAWQFPVGTRLWKEFAHAGHPIETRLIERLPDGAWRFATYVWNAQGTAAALAPERGIRRLSVPDAPSGVYAVPSRGDCRACHDGGPSPVLGFSALQLSPDRDPNVAHAEKPAAQNLDLARLQARGLLRNLPAPLRHTPPRIAAPDATARAALGYLHANCGHCHNDAGGVDGLDMVLLQRTADPAASVLRTMRSLFGRTSHYQHGASQRQSDVFAQRVNTGNVDASMLLQRMLSPQASQRMPPLGVSVPDAAGMALIRQWISSQGRQDLFSPPPQPQEKLP